MRPETDLLLCCAHSRPDQERIRNLVSSGIDWDFAIDQAYRHCVAPLLYWVLARPEGAGANCRDLLPDGIAERLENIFQTTFRRNLFLTGELSKALQVFEGEGLAAIAFKGPVLAALYYDNLGLREFGDLDILVRPEDASRAGGALASAGFRPSLYKTCPEEEFALPFARAFDFEMSYLSRNGSAAIDLHWALMPESFALPAAAREVWLRAETVPVAGRRVLTLSREDLLLFVCAHGSRHKWERLSWLRDVAAVLGCAGRSTGEIDWESVENRARKLRIRRPLFLGLALAGTLLGAAIPDAVRQHVEADATTERLAADIQTRIRSGEPPATGTLAGWRFLARSREDWRDALRCCVELVTRPTVAEWTAFPLPRFLFPFYYLVRPVRLFVKHIAGYREI